jgi:hypothetical protein
MNLQLFEEVEESVLDLYGGRNLYLQRRERGDQGIGSGERGLPRGGNPTRPPAGPEGSSVK